MDKFHVVEKVPPQSAPTLWKPKGTKRQQVQSAVTLFGKVSPASSNEVVATGLQQSGATASGELSWNMITGRIDL